MPNFNLSDEEALKQVQRGEVEAFEVIVERYQEKLLRYGRKFLNRNEDIEEIVQEIFVKAYVNAKGYDTSRKFSSWIYRIAHNEFVNALKKKKPLYFFDLDILLPRFVAKKNLEEETFRKEDREKISSLMDKLEFKYKEPLILHYFEDLSYKDISDILRIPVSTVGIRIKRAKEAIKKMYNI